MARRGQSGHGGVTRRSAWWLTLLTLTGCIGPDTGPTHLEEYLERLSTVTGLELNSGAPYESGRFDLPREQATESSASSQIDLIDFLSLSGCELQVNLGRRNTQLGRTASPSQRLLLDLEFMDLAPGCITLLQKRGDDELASTLAAVSVERKAQLSDSIARALLMGPEWRMFWERPATLGNYPATKHCRYRVLSRLADLTQGWLDGNWRAGNSEVELLLGNLRAGDGGTLSRHIHRCLGNWSALTRCAGLSHSAAAPTAAPQSLKALEQVVARFFVGAVRPWLVQLRQRTELLAPVTDLETPLLLALSPDIERG